MMDRVHHLLEIVQEECHEVGQRICKIQRFGLLEVQEGQELHNTERLRAEINDLFAAIEMLEESSMLMANIRSEPAVMAKKVRIEKYMQHARACGTLSGS